MIKEMKSCVGILVTKSQEEDELDFATISNELKAFVNN